MAAAPLRCSSVLITGCSRGLGLGLVKGLAEAPNSPDLIIATCRQPEAAQELQELSKRYHNIRILLLDIVSEESRQKLVKEVGELVGAQGLNCLINNAGRNISASLDNVTAETMLQVYETNTVAQLMMTKAFLPLLKQAAKQSSGMGWHRALIVNVSSISASIQLVQEKEIFLMVYPYRISKTALNMLTKCLAADLKEDGILCISLHPGWLQTDMGGKQAPMKVEESVPSIVSLLARLGEKDNGCFLDWKGNTIPW
uniref:C-factor-like isoform X2 n=1 Tax=Geotrypetes seraphini TaxID=260995 RepID=A0A6P8NPT1_GEOSA|nr:C-factor-like isoform X2 [Geotrypetes seraphini]